MNKLDVTNSGFMDRREANHIALTPISFLSRTADIYPTEQPLFTEICAIAGQRFMTGRCGWPTHWSRPA